MNPDELAVLTAGATGLGLGVAHATLIAARGVIPAEWVLHDGPAISWRVVGAAGAAAAIVMITGMLPAAFAWRAARRRGFGQRVAPDTRRLRAVRFALAAGQSALAMILALGASLFLRSHANLVGQETGFDESGAVVSVSYPPDRSGGPLGEDMRATIDGLRRLPGVRAAGAAIGPLVDDSGTEMLVRIEGGRAVVTAMFVTPAFFDAAGMELSRGRRLEASDANAAIVVNEALVRAHPGSVPGGDGASDGPTNER